MRAALLGFLVALPGAALAQSARPWLGASVGTGRLSIGGLGSSGISGEFATGIAFAHRIRAGVRGMHLTAVDIAGDQPTWSGGTWLGVLSWAADSAIALSAGVGRIHATESDFGLSGHGTVCETAFEFATPPGLGPGLRFVLTRTWSIGDARWNDGAQHGRISQLHIGVGGIFR